MKLRILTAAVLLWTAAATFSQEPAKTSIQGVVRRSGTEDPIAGAHVTLSRATSPPQQVAVTVTDETGKFMLMGIDQGAYRISVGKNGYVRYDSQGSITPLAGKTIDGIVVDLKQTATISGRVTSATGKPLGGITLKFLRRTYDADGSPIFTRTATVETNDLGEYRAYWITPGRYYLSASSVPFRPLDVRGIPSARWESYPEKFFPGVTDVSQALVIDLRQGADLRNVDFTLLRLQQLYNVRGRVSDAATGQAPANAVIFIGVGGTTEWYDPATGTFELQNMAPGLYSIYARFGGLDGSGPTTAATHVNLVNTDIENLVLTQSPLLIDGQIRVEGQWPSTVPMGTIGVRLVPVSASPADPLNVRIPPTATEYSALDGTFKINSNAGLEGEYRMKVSGLPGTFYLKEASMNGADAMRRPFRLSSSGHLDILISASSGAVSGRVLNGKMEPVSTGEAVLVPSESRNRPELFKRAMVVNGRFLIEGIAPGDYKVFAWERIEENAFFDPEVLRRFEERGAPVRVREMSQESVDVHLIPEVIF